MEKQISFSEGLVSQPYSDVSTDGQLSTMHNLEVHAGSVRPSVLLGSKFALNGELVFIHKTGYYTHYLYKLSDGSLYYRDAENATTEAYSDEATPSQAGYNLVALSTDIADLKQIAATGNVLTFLCEGKELQYAMWQDDEYQFLGVMPELNIKFALEGEQKYLEVENDEDASEAAIHATSGQNHGEYSYKCASKAIEEFVSKHCNENAEGFVYPFFVRAAWKLYDNTYAKFSCPVLMIPNTNYPCALPPTPLMYFRGNKIGIVLEGEDNTANDITFTQDYPIFIGNTYAIANVMNLLYRFTDVPENWERIIRGVEIMVSDPLVNTHAEYEKTDISKLLENIYKDWDTNSSAHSQMNDQASMELQNLIKANCCYGRLKKRIEVEKYSLVGNCGGWENGESGKEVKLLFREMNIETNKFGANEQSFKYDMIASIRGASGHEIVPWTKEPQCLESLSVDDMIDKISRVVFHHLKTIDYSELLDEDFGTNAEPKFTEIRLEENQYNSLSVKEDNKYIDTWSQDSYYPSNMIEYNSRLNLYNVKILHRLGPEPTFSLPYINELSGDKVDVYIKVVRDGSTKIVKLNAEEVSISYFDKIFYIYVPNQYAISYIIVSKKIINNEPENKYIELPLERSTTLDGVYYYNNDGYDLTFSNARLVDFERYIKNNDEEIRENYIFTTPVDNPFKIIASGLNQVGGGRIMKLAAMTKPLSEGQMGGFPLIAFCTDGNYALEVIKSGEDAGLYEGVTPMRPDVCINADSVLGIEEGIFFISQKGLMLMDANNAVLLSGSIDGVKDSFQVGTQDDIDTIRPRDYIAGCIPAWDYTNSRLLLLRKNSDKAYVFKADDKTWSSIELPASVKTVMSSYPHSYIQLNQNEDNGIADGTVVVLDDDYNYTSGQVHDGLIVTRPIKFDNLQLKRINEFSLHGNFTSGQKLTIYGSNNLKNWYCIGTTKRRHVGMMRGYYFKYWRFKIETSLKEDENISSIEVRYNIKNTGRLS